LGQKPESPFVILIIESGSAYPKSPQNIRLAYTGFVLTLTMKNLFGGAAGRKLHFAIWSLVFIIWDLEIV
jgi:hypothetical protein